LCHEVLTYKEYVSGVVHTIDIDPPTPSPPSECVLPQHQRPGGGLHTRQAVRGVGVNISEDARHWIWPLTVLSLYVSNILCRGFLPVSLYVVMAAVPFYIYFPVCKLCGVFRKLKESYSVCMSSFFNYSITVLCESVVEIHIVSKLLNSL
jgi:hypothetical protein